MDTNENRQCQNAQRDEMFVSYAFNALADSVFGKATKDSFDKQYDIRNALGRIADFYGKRAVLLEDSEDIEVQIDYAMNPLGVMHRPVLLDDDWYKNCVYPLLVKNVETGDYTALLPNNDNYVFYEVGSENKTVVNSRNKSNFSTEAICFYKPFPKGKLRCRDLYQFILDAISPKDIAMILLMIMAGTLIGMWVPRLSNALMDVIVETDRFSWLLSTVFFMGMATISNLLFNFEKSIYETRVCQKVSLRVNAAAMMKIYALPVPFFSHYSSGELSQRLECINEFCMGCLDIVFDTLFTALFSLVYLSQISKFASALLMPSLIIIVTDLIVEISAALISMRRMKNAMEIDAQERGILKSTITGIKKIKVAGAEKRIFARWATLTASGAALTYRPIVVKVIGTAVAGFGLIVMYNIAVQTGMSSANYYSFNLAYGNVASAFSALAAAGIAITKLKPTFEMAQPILEAETEEEEGRTVLRDLKGSIELNNVSFRYEENQPYVIEKMNLKITPGQYVAIVGRTGCGKSTLIKLLLGFVKPQSGNVSYDGYSLDMVDMKSLRSKIGTVLQNGKLFQGTVYSNIIVGKPTLSEEEVWKAAEIANIADDIRKMPMGMMTMLTERGGGISGGQQQRLLIARAIASGPKVLIFDEATSALDNISQKKISDALEQLNCTRIAVAHRLSTIRHCDRILVLDKGHIAEDGSYEELMAQNGIFADLVRRQL